MIIHEKLTEKLFKFWTSKTNIAIDLDLLIEDFIYQASLSPGAFIISNKESKSGLSEFFYYDWKIKEGQISCTLKGKKI